MQIIQTTTVKRRLNPYRLLRKAIVFSPIALVVGVLVVGWAYIFTFGFNSSGPGWWEFFGVSALTLSILGFIIAVFFVAFRLPDFWKYLKRREALYDRIED